MSMTKSGSLRCDECGKFISLSDLMDGKARHVLADPDSHFSSETFESACSKCQRSTMEQIARDRSRSDE